MRYNKDDLLALASQSSPEKYDKEGVLILRERSEGFFRRTEGSTKSLKRNSLTCVGPTGRVSSERWFRLLGNLLFYLKTSDVWSEPAGLIVLENYTVRLESSHTSREFNFIIQYDYGGYECLGASSPTERGLWMDKIRDASFKFMRSKIISLKMEVEGLIGRKAMDEGTSIDEPLFIKPSGYVQDICESPLCQISLSGDNLLCDSHGRPPSPRSIIHVRNNLSWVRYATTEVVNKNSNPVFLKTINFYESDGLQDQTELRISCYNVRERVSGIENLIGETHTTLASLKAAHKFRLPIATSGGTQGGFLTITVSDLEKAKGGSTESTPSKITSTQVFHRRTKSLPPRLGRKLGIPPQHNFHLILSHPFLSSFRFHSGLGGEIHVQEIMAECKYSYKLPLQLLSLWIGEEKELVEELFLCGELKEPWHSAQLRILTNHFTIINRYTEARKSLEDYNGVDFRLSSSKGDSTYEFVPVNLHLQRLWAANESLHLTGFHDILTSGAFTAIAIPSQQGLSKLLELYNASNDSSEFYVSNEVKSTKESVESIKRLRKEVVERITLILKLAKERKRDSIEKYVQDIFQRSRLLLSISDESLVEEALHFIEHQKQNIPHSKSSDCTSLGLEDRTPDSGLGIEESITRQTQEFEPWELTQCNIEASLISLKSKMSKLSGQAGSGLDEDWAEELSGSLKKLKLAMDGLLRTSRLTHSVFRLRETEVKSELGFRIKYRRDVCFSQALTSVVSGLMIRLWCGRGEFISTWTRFGPLVHCNGLLTPYGPEEVMLEDMKVAIEDLKSVEFRLTLYTGSGAPVPKISGSRWNLKVILPIPQSHLQFLQPPSSFTLTPVFFNVGINEKASYAERFKNIETQDRLNFQSLESLASYAQHFKNTQMEMELSDLVGKLRAEVNSKKKKNVEILHISSRISRLVHGLQLISCKSGKDRTGMGVTLEEIRILSEEYDLGDKQAGLDALRSEGTRRENTLKNIGVRKYAFNSLQVYALPSAYRPPPGTFGANQT